MEEAQFISICIPAFGRKEYLTRLLNSIEIQNFRRFEVVITDDSPGYELQELVENHRLRPMIRYFKNRQTLGSPENWNEGLRKAGANWIKIMHDDDWFKEPDSLGLFAEIIEKGRASFYFSAYTNIYPNGHTKNIRLSLNQLRLIRRVPEILFAANRIGPPSSVIFKMDGTMLFDQRMKWLVDIDFYIRYLRKHGPAEYIPKDLIQIGISGSQITSSSFGKPEIEIPERFMLAEKLESTAIRHISIFDAWWRFIRNLSIVNISQIKNSGYEGKIPDFIPLMIQRQNKIPKSLLRQGLFSKMFMFIFYLKIRKQL
jgi:glycosyltransferase involved in cell wall biosynthesis